MLAMALTGHAPRLAAFLSAPAWRPLAVLSYSVYLLQYVGALPFDPLFATLISPRLGDLSQTPLWLGALVAHSKTLLLVACTLPLALLNYLCVERPMMLYGRKVAAQLAAAASSTGGAAGARKVLV